MLSAIRSLADIDILFPDEYTCNWYLEKLKWKDAPVSPYDPSARIRHVGDFRYKCLSTGRYFTARTGTIFHGTKTSLIHWFKVIWLLETKPTISTLKAAELTGFNQKTIWNMQQRLKAVKVTTINR